MAGNLQPLVNNQRIVKDDGTPTDYFIRWAQQKQIDIGSGITAEQAVQIITQYLADHELQAGSGIQITPSGNLSDTPTIAAEVQAILDQITTTQGSILFRGVDDWQALAPGTSGHFLKTNGAGADPAWAAGGGGGGGSAWTIVASYSQAIDGNVPNFDSPDLSGYNEIFVQFDSVNSSSARVVLLLSTDGSTFYNAVGNYADMAGTGVPTNNAALFGNTTASAAVRSSSFHIYDIGNTVPIRHVHLPIRGASQIFQASGAPILKVRAASSNASGTSTGNINAGTITMLAR